VKSKKTQGLRTVASRCPKGQSRQSGLPVGSTFITKHIGKYWVSLSIATASLHPVDYVSVCEP
jgi:hypothetical protein